MNCETFRERLSELFDREPTDPDLREHADLCAGCRAEWMHAQRVIEPLAPRQQFHASPGFTERVLQKAMESPPRRVRLGWLAAAAAAVAILIPVWQTISTERRPAASLLAQSVAALSDIRSFQMTGHMRSPEGEPFEFIDL